MTQLRPLLICVQSMEMIRKLILTGYLVLIPEKYHFLRIFLGIVCSISFLILLTLTKPYRQPLGNTFAILLQGFTTVVLVGMLGIKQCEEEGELSCTALGINRFVFAVIIIGISGLVGLAMLLTFLKVAYEVRSVKMNVIIFRTSHAQPVLSLPPASYWHAFLSHTWATGQDQVGTMKSKLTVLLPDLRCFLDVRKSFQTAIGLLCLDEW
jgi:hypothetical protein